MVTNLWPHQVEARALLRDPPPDPPPLLSPPPCQLLDPPLNNYQLLDLNQDPPLSNSQLLDPPLNNSQLPDLNLNPHPCLLLAPPPDPPPHLEEAKAAPTLHPAAEVVASQLPLR